MEVPNSVVSGVGIPKLSLLLGDDLLKQLTLRELYIPDNCEVNCKIMVAKQDCIGSLMRSI